MKRKATTMTKKAKQTEIPGFERQVENEEVEKAATKYYDLVFERSALSKKEAVAKLELQATMAAQKVTKYRFWDENAEAWRIARIDVKETVVIDKDAEQDGEPADDTLAGNEGLLADAKKAQRDAGVAEDDEGDVVPVEASAPKKRGGKGKRRS